MIKVRFVLPYKGTENNPADYKQDDEAELPEDLAWNLAMLGVLKFKAQPDPEVEEIKRAQKASKKK